MNQIGKSAKSAEFPFSLVPSLNQGFLTFFISQHQQPKLYGSQNHSCRTPESIQCHWNRDSSNGTFTDIQALSLNHLVRCGCFMDSVIQHRRFPTTLFLFYFFAHFQNDYFNNFWNTAHFLLTLHNQITRHFLETSKFYKYSKYSCWIKKNLDWSNTYRIRRVRLLPFNFNTDKSSKKSHVR